MEAKIHLSSLQHCAPVISALTVSPCVFLASSVQLVAGSIFASVAKANKKITGKESSFLDESLHHVKEGKENMKFSATNILTLGIPSFVPSYMLGKQVQALNLQGKPHKLPEGLGGRY